MILVIALLVLGPSRLPETARSLGRGWREFRESIQGLGDGFGEDDEDDDRREPRARRDDPAGLPVDPRHVIGDGVVDDDDYPDDDSLEGYADEYADDDLPDDDFPDAGDADGRQADGGDADEPARTA